MFRINNVIKLEDYLKRKFKGRYESLGMDLNENRLKASIDGEVVKILFQPKRGFKIAAVDGGSKEVLEKLVPYLNKLMKNQGPIVSFEAKKRGTDNPGAPSMEWDIVSPDLEIQELVNNRGVGENYDVTNLVILNGKDPSEYLDSEEDKAQLKAFFRVYGIDSGRVIPEKVANMPEGAIYLFICEYEQIIFECELFNSFGCLGYEDYTEEKYSVDYLKQLTTKFGVEMGEPEVEKRVLETPSYQAWKKFWYNHFKEFTKEQLDELKRRIEVGEDFDEFLPNTSWKDSFEMTMTPRNESQN